MSILRNAHVALSNLGVEGHIRAPPDCLKVMLFALLSRHGGCDRIYEVRRLFVAVGLYVLFTVLPHWYNKS